MAKGLDRQTLKREAAEKMQQARYELDTEIQRMRVQYNPSRMARSVMEQHGKTLLAVAFGLGVLVPMVLFRKSSVAAEVEKKGKEVYKKEKKQATLLGTIISNAAKSAAPLAVKWLMNAATKMKTDMETAAANARADAADIKSDGAGVEEFTPGR